MTDWNILGDDNGDDNVSEDFEYVGVVEENEAAGPVREPARQAARNRRMVRKVAPQQQVVQGQPVYPVQRAAPTLNAVIGASNRDEEDIVSYIDMPYGKQLGLTPEAVKRMQSEPIGTVNGQAAQRIEPGTYVMYGPQRAGEMGGMGTNGDAPAAAQSGAPGWLGDMFGAIGRVTGSIVGAVSEGRQQRREMGVERLRIFTEAEAAAEARDVAFQETQLEHAERMARIQSGAAELEELQRQAEAAAALRQQAPIGAGAGGDAGASPVVWILLSVVGLGAVGGAVWYFGFREKDEE